MDALSPVSRAFTTLRSSGEKKEQRFVDYAVGLVLIEIIIIAALALLGPGLSPTFEAIDASLGGGARYTSCEAVFADGYAAAPGDAHTCYSPTHGEYDLR